MGLSFNYYTSIISVTSPQTILTMQELADAIEDDSATPWGMSYPANDDPGIAEIAGKFDKGSGKFSEIIVQLYSPWQVQFWGGSGVTSTTGGSLLGGLGGVPVKATGTAGDITLVSQPVDGTLIVSGSGVTQQDKQDIADLSAQEVGDLVVDPSLPLSLKNAMLAIMATAAGKAAGGGTTTIVFRNAGDTGNAVEMAVDESGNRSSIILTLP